MGVILANVILAITFAFLLVAGMLGIALLAVIATLFFHLNLGLPNDGNKQYETSEDKDSICYRMLMEQGSILR